MEARSSCWARTFGHVVAFGGVRGDEQILPTVGHVRDLHGERVRVVSALMEEDDGKTCTVAVVAGHVFAEEAHALRSVGNDGDVVAVVRVGYLQADIDGGHHVRFLVVRVVVQQEGFLRVGFGGACSRLASWQGRRGSGRAQGRCSHVSTVLPQFETAVARVFPCKGNVYLFVGGYTSNVYACCESDLKDTGNHGCGCAGQGVVGGSNAQKVG